MDEKDSIAFELGSDNIFADLGLPNAAEELAKAQLGQVIRDAIRHRGMTHAQAARVMGESRPNVTAIIGGRVGRFSLDRLMRSAAALGYRLTITLEPTSNGLPGDLTIAQPGSQHPAPGA